MEVDVVDVVKSLGKPQHGPRFQSSNRGGSEDESFQPERLRNPFGEAFEKIAPGAQLASPAIFGTHEMKEKIKVGATNKEVLDVIRKEADGSN